jgi:hypothetical protein
MELGIAIYLLLTHFFADFIMQTDEMAKNKSESNYWLTRHVVTYTVTSACFYYSLIFLCLILSVFVVGAETLGSYQVFISNSLFNLLIFILINGVLHWVTDYFTSRASKHYYKQGKSHEFFIVVGLDQFIHHATLLTTFQILFF